MEYKNVLTVIDELGALLKKHKDEIDYKNLQIEHLQKKIERIENFANSYSKE